MKKEMNEEQIKASLDDEKEFAEKNKDQLWEDTSILEDEQIERDLIDMLNSKMPKSMFQDSCKVMLGDKWQDDGLQIIKDNAPMLMERFKEYASNEESA